MLIRTDSVEYVSASVTADHDLTGRAIDVALPWSGSEPLTWYRAEVTSITNASGSSTAVYRLLIGPNTSIPLKAGNYDWYVRVIDNPEKPVRLAGLLMVRA